MCDPRDLGRTLGDGDDDDHAPGRDPFARRTGQFDPTLILFDSIPGGVGLAERIFERSRELLERTHALIASCGCRTGCPACVGPTEGDGSNKRLALRVLSALVASSPENATLRSGALGSSNDVTREPRSHAHRVPAGVATVSSRHE
jgi:DEAD/DEAH box helicase domain-containing protein